jgi:hypothetical protein
MDAFGKLGDGERSFGGIDDGGEVVGLPEPLEAAYVIGMGMGDEERHGQEFLGGQEVAKSLLLTGLKHTGIDDDGMAQVVPEDVGALTIGVEVEYLGLHRA